MPVALSLFLVLFFLLMNAFFVVAEFSLGARAPQPDRHGWPPRASPAPRTPSLVAHDVNAYLSACQLGITLGLPGPGLAGRAGRLRARSTRLLRPALGRSPSTRPFPPSAVAIGFVIITALHIVVGELIPKSLAIFSTETLRPVHG